MSTVIGGPVAGLVVPDDTAAAWVASRLHVYDWAGGHYILSGGVAIIWEATGQGSATAASVNPRQVGRAWHKMTHVLSVEAPHAIRQSKVARARLKRLAR